MINSLIQRAAAMTESPKIAVSVASATWSSGLAAAFEVIPEDMGKLSAVVGIVLSIVLLITHIKKDRRDTEKHTLEVLLLKEQLETAHKENTEKETN